MKKIVLFATLCSAFLFVACKKNDPKDGSNDNDSKNDTKEAVDLGLSVKWATCNVGATSPEKYGNYYAWGETTTKSDYSWATYKYGTYYFDGGQITVSYPDSAIIDLVGEVKTHYGSEIHFSYRGKFAFEEYNRQDSTQTASAAPRKHKGARQ